MKQETKTVKQWLETLPEPIRSQALRGMFPKNADRISPSARHAILAGVDWFRSPEDVDYWTNIYIRAGAGEFDKQQPVSETQISPAFSPQQIEKTITTMNIAEAMFGEKKPRTFTAEQVEAIRRNAFEAGVDYGNGTWETLEDKDATKAYETWAKENPIV